MATIPASKNPLMDFADKHSLKKPGFVRKIGQGLGRGLKFGSVELEKSLINPTFSNAIRSIFNVSPLTNTSNANYGNVRQTLKKRTTTNVSESTQPFERAQFIMLNKIYQLTAQNEKHLRGITTLIGLNKETNSLLKNFITPKIIKPKTQEVNPFEIPKAANNNSKFANDNSMPSSFSSGGILSSILGSIGASSVSVFVKVAKKFLSKVLTKIPVFGPLLGVMFNLPGAIEVFEKEGFGSAFVDLISGIFEDATFGVIDKDKFKQYFTRAFKSLYDGVLHVGEKISKMFTDVAEMITELLKKIKIGPIKIPDILGGGTIEWDPFKEGLKIDTPPPPMAEPAGVGDQANSPYAAKLDTVAAADQFAARQDAMDPRRDKNIEVIGKWEGRQTGDIISPEMLRNETGGGQQEYLNFLKMLIDSGQAKLTDKPINVQPRIERQQPVGIPDYNPGADELGSVTIRPPNPQTPHVPLPRRPLFSSVTPNEDNERNPAANVRADAFIRNNEMQRGNSQRGQAPVIINAPVTNVTGARSGNASNNERTSMGSATLHNTWELRAAHGILVGIPS